MDLDVAKRLDVLAAELLAGDHAAHQVAGLDGVYAVAVAALEAVVVEQGEEELEVLLLGPRAGWRSSAADAE